MKMNGKVNLSSRFDEEARAAKLNQAKQDLNKDEDEDPFKTIKIIQKNLLSDYDEIIDEKRAYGCLLHTEISSQLYHIEKLSELIGKAKAINKSKIYKADRRAALQKAIDLFNRVKDRLTVEILDQLKNSYKRPVSETYSHYDSCSPRLARSCSAQEIFNRNIHESMELIRQRIDIDVPDTVSESSNNSSSNDSADSDDDYCVKTWSRNRLSSSSNSYFQPFDDNNNFKNWGSYGCYPTPCISPPLSGVTPLYTNQAQSSATPCISPPLPNATPLYSWNGPPMSQKLPEPSPSLSEDSIMNDDLFSGQFSMPNDHDHMDDMDSIQATLKSLGNFENFDAKSTDSNENDYMQYYYEDGELTEIKHPKHDEPSQSNDSSEVDYTDWRYLALTQANLTKFETMFRPPKKLADEQKVETIKRKIDDVYDEKMDDNRNPKKVKMEPKKVTFQLVREKKLYVKESPTIDKIVKKYKK